MDLMIDVETCHTSARAALLSLGVVAFDPLGTKVERMHSFYRNISLQSCLDLGLEVSGDTIMWWMKQSEAARSALFTPEPLPVDVVMRVLTEFCKRYMNRDSYIWSHGATFDVPICSEIYAKLGQKPPWLFYKVHDTRTVFDYTEKLPSVNTRVGGHNALEDAIAQAEHLQKMLKRLLGGKVSEEEIPEITF